MSFPRSSAVPAWVAAVCVGLAGLTGPTARAEEFPSRPITLVVPYPPGSATDFVARLLQPRLSEALRQSVVVDNRGGASTNIGTEFVARSAPDGHTVLMQVPNLVTNEFFFKGLRWKRDDFAPVGTLVRWSNVLVAGPSGPFADVKGMLAATNSSSWNYGTPGIGSLSHLAVEMLKARTGLTMQHVTFTGTAPMITGLLGGSIQYGATNPASFMSFARDPKYRLTPMVVLGSQRDSTIPDVPSLADFGITGIESYGWAGVLVPARTPQAVVARLNEAFMKVMRSPDIVEKLKANYLEPLPGTPDEFARLLAAEHRKWGETIAAAGIKAE
jgi:tripartite-type tricarboxylate transporter receptor subunit TctC